MIAIINAIVAVVEFIFNAILLIIKFIFGLVKAIILFAINIVGCLYNLIILIFLSNKGLEYHKWISLLGTNKDEKKL